VSRAKKLLIVAVVLATGIGLSLPFRKFATQSPDFENGSTGPAGPRTPLATEMPPSGPFGRQGPLKGPGAATNFNLENHSAFAGTFSGATEPTVTPQPPLRPYAPFQVSQIKARSADSTVDGPLEGDSPWPREVVHVVEDGDTLENLAKRYMGDASHALEIFDMNRAKLANPHQLPIAARLRIPVAPGRVLD